MGGIAWERDWEFALGCVRFETWFRGLGLDKIRIERDEDQGLSLQTFQTQGIREIGGAGKGC